MISNRNLGSLMGAPVVDRNGDRIGTVAQVFVDAQSGNPDWVTVHTGLFGRHESFVPIGDAEWDYDTLRVTVDKAQVKDAPRVDTDGALSVEDEEALFRYYQAPEPREARPATTDGDDRDDDATTERTMDGAAATERTAGDRTAGDRTIDDRMGNEGAARSDTDRRSGGVRLRRYTTLEEEREQGVNVDHDASVTSSTDTALTDTAHDDTPSDGGLSDGAPSDGGPSDGARGRHRA